MTVLLGLAVLIGVLAVGALLLVLLFEYGPVIAALGIVALLVGFAGMIGSALVHGGNPPTWTTVTAIGGLIAMMMGVMSRA